MITAKRGKNTREFPENQWNTMPSTKYGWVQVEEKKKPEPLTPEPKKDKPKAKSKAKKDE